MAPRKSSRLPGGFDNESPEPEADGESRHGGEDEGDDTLASADEHKMHRNLMDLESSFIPSAPSPLLQSDGPAQAMNSEQHENNVPATPAADSSALETMSSSPTAAAAARTVSRAVSMATLGGYETADDRSPERSGADSGPETEKGSSPQQESGRRVPTARMHQRQVSQVSAVDSLMSQDSASDATLGADYALQSGGAVPATTNTGSTAVTEGGLSRLTPARHVSGLSRQISLGSIASGISGIDEGDDTVEPGRSLSRLEEEDGMPDPAEDDEQMPFQTPKATSAPTAPSDTVIAQHIQNIHVPASVARQYRESNRPPSPAKRAVDSTAGETPGPLAGRGKGLALKEQISTIDRLHNQNWDLKLKIHFLDQALKRQSEEGVKEMISENVELKAGLASLEKQARNLRKQNRELERKFKEQETSKDRGEKPDEDGHEREVEVFQLRQTVEHYERETERLHNEGITREAEKRRLAELVQTLTSKNKKADPDVAVREEIEAWKELLASETAHKDQALEQIRELKEDNWRLQSRSQSTVGLQTRSRSRGSDVNSTVGGSSTTLVDHLRHENEELRRVNGAQTAMLTSRLRERERLCQELEELKLGQMRGADGDSILERSASRASGAVGAGAGGLHGGSHSTIGGIGDGEREEYENSVGLLRDQVAEMRLRNQDLEVSLERHLNELEQLEGVKADMDVSCKRYEEEMDELANDLQTMQGERDESLNRTDVAERDYEELKAEAQSAVDGLEKTVGEQQSHLKALETEIGHREENFAALQNEMRTMSEGLVRLEDDHEANLHRLKSLQQELDDANREVESLEKAASETNAKIERLTVQQESSQSEINFLREEQDGDKIKIGDLETALKKAEIGIAQERERARELDRRLAEERHQREVVGGKEKQEVQKIVNELNREAAGAKDEARRLRQALSSREVESTEWKERLVELEANLRETLGLSQTSSSRSSLLNAVAKLQSDLSGAFNELETSKAHAAESDALLRERDALLEDTGLEAQKLAELLDRERHARRTEQAHIEQVQRSSQQSSRTLTAHVTRVAELESARHADRKKLSHLETTYRDQLHERNSLLSTLARRLSVLCGPEWAKKYPLPADIPMQTAHKTLLAAVKYLEVHSAGLSSRIRTLERDLWKDYHTLQAGLETRIKRLDRLESLVSTRTGPSSESIQAQDALSKIRDENKLLKAELAAVVKKRPRTGDRRPPELPRTQSSEGTASSTTLARSTSTLDRPATSTTSSAAGPIMDPSEARWIARLREMERRLKQEREARLLDRSGARKRLEEGQALNEELRFELERERQRE